jgi:hypothetical protein
MNNNSISPSEIGYDMIGHSRPKSETNPETETDWNVGDWLNTDENNLVIKYKTKTNEYTNFLLNNNTLIIQLGDSHASQIKCPVSETARFFNPNGKPTLYIDLSLIGIVGVVVERNDIITIKKSMQNKNSTRLYEIVPASNVDNVDDMWSFVQSKMSTNIKVAPESDNIAISKCDTGEFFSGKIIEINIREEPVLGGKRKSSKKRKTATKRKSAKKRNSTKKRKSAKK